MPSRLESQALAVIRRCVARDRVLMTIHFRQRLAQRGLLWADLLTLFESPTSLRPDGSDDQGRERWIVRGDAATGGHLAVVCAIERSRANELAVFITRYWEK